MKPTPNEVYYRNDSASSPFGVENSTLEFSKSLCQQNVHENTIEIMLGRKNFFKKLGKKHVWIIGRHFKAYVSYTPHHYDPDLTILKVELFKLYQEVERIGSANETVQDQLIPRTHLIENVRTFAVLPTDEIIVFFSDQFCYINYYNLEVCFV